MNEPEEPERPWNEAHWEKFMNESDVRSAKYGELLETFIDHPDRDAIIDHEMGWDREDGGNAEFSLRLDDDEEEPDWSAPDSEEDAGDATDADDIDPFEDDEDDLKEMPAYSRAYDFGLRVHEFIKPYLVPDREDQDEDLIDAMSNGFIIAAKLAGAHGMGYDDDVLCGNIVTCKKSQTAAADCLRALQSLRERGVTPPPAIDPLIEECEQVKALVDVHIAELRGRVWWD